MIGNLKLFADADGQKFNEYAYFMTHNPLIKFVSYGLYFFILLHAAQGIMIAVQNRMASGGSRYKGNEVAKTEARVAARNMAMLGLLILAFLLLHMGQFWAQMKLGWTEKVTYADSSYGAEHQFDDLYAEVAAAFSVGWVIIAYLVGLVALSLHLMHGVQSSFQTLGLNHKKYTPAIKAVGLAFAIIIPVGFASMPIYFFVEAINSGAYSFV